MGIPALPYCKVVLKAEKSKSCSFPKNLKTLGDHLKTQRLKMQFSQKEIAKIIGTDEASIWNWENNRHHPSLAFLPKIIKFLGYVPDSCAHYKTFGEKIVAYRKFLGITQKELACYLGIDPTTLGRYEKRESMPKGKILEKINAFFTSATF